MDRAKGEVAPYSSGRPALFWCQLIRLRLSRLVLSRPATRPAVSVPIFTDAKVSVACRGLPLRPLSAPGKLGHGGGVVFLNVAAGGDDRKRGCCHWRIY